MGVVDGIAIDACGSSDGRVEVVIMVVVAAFALVSIWCYGYRACCCYCEDHVFLYFKLVAVGFTDTVFKRLLKREK